MKQFSHPHIIKLFGIVTNGPTTYIVMELAPLGQVCIVYCMLIIVLVVVYVYIVVLY